MYVDVHSHTAPISDRGFDFAAPSVCLAHKQSRLGSEACTIPRYRVQYSIRCCVVPAVSRHQVVSTILLTVCTGVRLRLGLREKRSHQLLQVL